MDIHQNLTTLHKKLREYETLYSCPPNSVVLLGASKGQSLEKIQTAIAAGQKIFGENYVQEALEKMAALADMNLEWHFIGTIQSNKTKKIAEHFAWVQSVSDQHILERLHNQRPAHLPALNICLEVNVSHEATKSGLTLPQLLPLAELCQKLDRVKLRGLMAIPAAKTSLDEQRVEFRKLKQLFDQLNEKGFKLDTLSMGMSNDMEAAVAEGSTMVRIGTALFGPRL